MRPKEGYKGKWKIEATNSDQPFKNVEEGLKISFFTVYDMPQNNLYIGQKYYTRRWHTREEMKQVQQGGLKK